MLFFVSFIEIFMANIHISKAKNWWAELPSEVKLSVKRGLEQSKRGELIPHEEVMKHYKKFLKK